MVIHGLRGADLQSIPEWLSDVLVCPRDRMSVERRGDTLVCGPGHEYPIVDGVPVMLVEEVARTHPYCESTLAAVKRGGGTAERATAMGSDDVDDFVQQEIVKTNGFLYQELKGSLKRYPIPDIRLPAGEGKTLLDVGCNWGRWTVSAARKGYRAVGLDPSLDAVLAATRVALALNVETWHVVGDARMLPFAERSFAVGYSYGVFQHFSKEHANEAIAELARVTEMSGTVLVQMANRFGLRQAYNATRAWISSNDDEFRIRYWTPRELQTTFARLVGPCELSVDGFFALNPQPADLDMLARRYAAVVRTSEALRRLAARQRCRLVGHVADSVYVRAEKELHGGLQTE
jgi:SAM-dependent methyltransferase/uncharacterized protein YbaR (Trm112 family)